MKRLWKTKTFWGGIASIATGIGLVWAGDIPQGVTAIMFGIQSIFIRDAIAKATK